MSVHGFYSLSGIDGRPEALRNTRAAIIGHICALARHSRWHAQLPVGQFIQMIEDACDQGCIKWYFNDFGRCMGYVCWAYVTPQVEQRLLLEGNYPLHLYEWKEGSSLWIVDFLVPRGALPRVLADLRDVVFANDYCISYFRAKSGRRIFKRISR